MAVPATRADSAARSEVPANRSRVASTRFITPEMRSRASRMARIVNASPPAMLHPLLGTLLLHLLLAGGQLEVGQVVTHLTPRELLQLLQLHAKALPQLLPEPERPQ